MFNIGFAELLVILLIAFVVVGPKDLPKIARALGRFVKYIRKMIEEVKRESGLDEVENELKTMERKIDEGVRSVDIRQDLQKKYQEACPLLLLQKCRIQHPFPAQTVRTGIQFQKL